MFFLYALIAIVFINCCYYLLFSKFSFSKNTSVKKNKTAYPVSVIVCAKNEAENLKKHIPLWLAQEYSKFELIIINDASSDDTLEVIESFQESDSRIKVVDVKNIEPFWGNKKYALTLGIKKAINKRMVFTDADCKPASDMWLQHMMSFFSEEKQLVLGYGAYTKKWGLLNALIRFETLMTALQYFSYAKAGIPYMGVGRNLGYTSPLYYTNNGFMSHINVPSGDDDLFVNQVATKYNTTIIYHPDSFTYSTAKEKWSQWIFQKRRHITTSNKYKFKHRLLLGLYFIFRALFWVCTAICFTLYDWKYVTVVILVKFLVQYVIVGSASVKLKEKGLLFFIPFLDLMLVLFQMYIFILNSISAPSRWK